MKQVLIGLGFALLCVPAAADTPPSLSLPLKCSLGKDCFIQQYTDIDPGPEARDYRCGSATYDGHKGTDFRVLSLEAAARGVPVLASAPGGSRACVTASQDRLIAYAGGSPLWQGPRMRQWRRHRPWRRMGNAILPYETRQRPGSQRRQRSRPARRSGWSAIPATRNSRMCI